MNLIVKSSIKIKSQYDAYREWRMGTKFNIDGTPILISNKDKATLISLNVRTIVVKVNNCYFVLFPHHLGL